MTVEVSLFGKKKGLIGGISRDKIVERGGKGQSSFYRYMTILLLAKVNMF